MIRRETIRYGESLGWVFEGFDGQGHMMLAHPVTGARYSISATPSDGRAEQNDRAALRRLSGNRRTSTTVRTADERREAAARARRREVLARTIEANRRNAALLTAQRRRQLMAEEDNFRFYDRLMRSGPSPA